ncbi:hypothetical protein [Legionella sp. WA2024007413]
MEQNSSEEVKCGACGILFDKINSKEVEVLRIKKPENEQIIQLIYLCPHCAEHSEKSKKN